MGGLGLAMWPVLGVRNDHEGHSLNVQREVAHQGAFTHVLLTNRIPVWEIGSLGTPHASVITVDSVVITFGENEQITDINLGRETDKRLVGVAERYDPKLMHRFRNR